MKYYIDILSIQTPKHLRKGLENRTRFDAGNFEINVFETFQSSTKVQIQYEGLSISGMVRGKKVVHSDSKNSFDFLPGTTLIIPEGKIIYADFPESNEKNPVQCVTLLIPHLELEKQLLYLNTHYPKKEGIWELNMDYYHFNNNSSLVRAFNEFTELMLNNENNYALNDLMLKTFLVRVLDAQNDYIEVKKQGELNNQLFLVKNYINNNLSKNVSLAELMEIGNCSKSTLFRLFENYCNKTPGDYIMQQRMEQVRNLLLNPNYNISDVSFMTGFSSVSYFTKQFKIHHNCTPRDFIKKYGVS